MKLIWIIQSPIKGEVRENVGSLKCDLCPCCSSDLRIQSGYSNGLSFWTCKVCGEMLINPEIEDSE